MTKEMQEASEQARKAIKLIQDANNINVAAVNEVLFRSLTTGDAAPLNVVILKARMALKEAKKTFKDITAKEENDYECSMDQIQELTYRLAMGKHGAAFTDQELNFIESWGGNIDADTGRFYDPCITSAYKIEAEDESKQGQYTYPKLAAMLRQQKAKHATFSN